MRESPDSDGFAGGLQDAEAGGGALPLGLPAWAWSLLVFVACAALSFWFAGRQQSRADAQRAHDLAAISGQTRDALEGSLHSSERLLRAVQTVFLSSESVTAPEFETIYDNLRARAVFPELQAIVYARREAAADGDHFLTAMYAPRAGNARLRGLDVASQPTNYAALLSSRDSDEVVMSAPFPLIQGAANPQDAEGIALRLPVYSPGPPPTTVPERRRRFAGSLGASFRVHRLIAGALPEAAAQRLHVVVEEVASDGQHLLYDSRPGAAAASDGPVSQSDIHFGGRVWRVRTRPLGPGHAPLDWQQSSLWPGLLASLLLSLLVWSVATTRRRAIELGRRMSTRYRESEQRFRKLNDLLPALVLVADAGDGCIVYANEAACARLGAQVEDGARLASLFGDPGLQAQLEDPGARQQLGNLEAELVSLEGDRFWASISLAMVPFDGIERLLLVASDISDQRQLTDLLSYQASHDALTELYNRREFERRVVQALQAAGPATPCALLYIDLDQFKLINDTSGHLAGDQLLSQLALAMAGQLRPGDTLARLGGDEFGVLARQTDARAAMQLAERLRVRIEEHVYVWEQRSYTTSASVGVVMLDRPGMNLGEVLTQADTACYMAKDHGRNRIHFYSEQDDEAIHRRSEMEWVNRLRWAIEEGRLLLDYQQLAPLQEPGGEPHIELLLRLRDEDGRVVAPGAFLPAAERYGLVSQLDRWVIAEAVANFEQLHSSGRAPGRCALNLSAATLDDDGLVDFVLELIERHGVAPSRLCFEITETVAVRNLARATRFIDRLRAVGCLVALDDFGAGMSSFGYLKNLPVDVIKIDGSFIRDLDGDPMSRTIVEAISEIGHQRGLDVVAEWVATDSVIETLRALRVDYAQGYAVHRPEPVLYQRAARSAAR